MDPPFLFLTPSSFRISGSDGFAVKNTIYTLAKTSKVVLSPEAFALELATHFVTKYNHIHKAFVDIEQLKWSRIVLEEGPNAQGHKHSFIRDGDEKRTAKAEVRGLTHVLASVRFNKTILDRWTQV